jgi:DNA polymerase-3 subunit epsilon
MPAETAIVHKITDDMVANGQDLPTALELLLQRLKGKVLIAHHARIEIGLLNKVCQDLYQQKFFIPTIDTQILGQRVLERHQEEIKPGDLRLFNLRKRFGLPAYKAHNALSDALATAELFLALLSDLYPKQNCKLKDVLTR